MRARCHNAGFTLVELVITLVLSAIVMGFVSMFVSGPVSGFMDQSRRVRLVDAADTALRRMGRDVRGALPNSIRTTAAGGVAALELLGTVDGGRYRAQPPGAPEQILDFSAEDGSFDALAAFTTIVKPFSSGEHYLSIYNVGVPGADAYAGGNVPTPVITRAGTQITIAVDGATGEDRVTLTPPFRFAYTSPTQRVFLVNGPVTYLCNPLAGTLMRYWGYTIAANQADRDSHGELLANGATASLMANQLAACTFTYTPGTAERAGLVSLEMRVSADGESISLLSQVHVDNVP